MVLVVGKAEQVTDNHMVVGVGVEKAGQVT
jgi:hypothetical protein